VRHLLIALFLLSRTASADRVEDPISVIESIETTEAEPTIAPPAFAFNAKSTAVAPATLDDARQDRFEPVMSETPRGKKLPQTIATARDGKAAWVAADLGEYGICGLGDCANRPATLMLHAVALFDGGRPIVWSFSVPIAAAEQAKQVARGRTLPAIPRALRSADEVVKVFEASLASSAALGKTVSDRKDVVLYGSELGERFVGGAAVRAKLQKWKLTFKVRDGIQAGLTSSRTVAWVAANLDGTPAAGKTLPYRALVIYEKTGDGWKIVQLSFSFIAPDAL
jgi:ketosteroid isomerase-like protein